MRMTVEGEYRVERVQDREVVESFLEFAGRNHHELMLEHLQRPEVIVVGARYHDEPIGLALSLIESKEVADVISVFVAKPHRLRGIASLMIEQIEQIVKPLGNNRLLLGVTKDSQFTPIASVLKRCEWDPKPRGLKRLISWCGPEMKLDKAPWLRRRIQNADVEVLPWSEVTESELLKLKEDASKTDCWFPKSLSPIVDNTNIHAPTSIGLRFRGELIGWSITHKFMTSPVVFSVMFAKKVPEFPLAGLALLQATADRLIELGKSGRTPLSCAILDGNKFYDFMARKVFPYLDTETQDMWVFRKVINS